MRQTIYEILGQAKSLELSSKSKTFWDVRGVSESRKNAQVGGIVLEGLGRDFIREFLPPECELKSGLVFDSEIKTMSPQCDGIIYNGAPLLNFTDVVLVEKEQVRAIVEIKTYIDQTSIFGALRGKTRDQNTGLASHYIQSKNFLPSKAKYILFAFDLWSSSNDAEVIERLKEISDLYAIIRRFEPKAELKAGKKREVPNFDGSVSRLIKWLRSLHWV